MPSRYSVLNTCFLSFFRLNEEARCNLQFRMHQNVAFSQILWPWTDKYDMKVWFGIFFWTLTPSHFFMSLANLSGGEFVLLWSWKQIVVKQCWKSSLVFKKHAMTVKSGQLSDYKCRIAEKAKHSLTHFMGEGYRLLHYERQEDLCFEIQNTSMMRRWGENWRK